MSVPPVEETKTQENAGGVEINCHHWHTKRINEKHDRCIDCGLVSDNEYQYHRKSGDLRKFTRTWPA